MKINKQDSVQVITSHNLDIKTTVRPLHLYYVTFTHAGITVRAYLII